MMNHPAVDVLWNIYPETCKIRPANWPGCDLLSKIEQRPLSNDQTFLPKKQHVAA